MYIIKTINPDFAALTTMQFKSFIAAAATIEKAVDAYCTRTGDTIINTEVYDEDADGFYIYKDNGVIYIKFIIKQVE